LSADLDAKRLELLKEVVPGLKRVTILQNPEFPQAEMRSRDAEAAAKLLQLQSEPWKVRSLSDIEAVFSTVQTSRSNGMSGVIRSGYFGAAPLGHYQTR
jgi:putative ABC transport system substrate-binding protein